MAGRYLSVAGFKVCRPVCKVFYLARKAVDRVRKALNLALKVPDRVRKV